MKTNICRATKVARSFRIMGDQVLFIDQKSVKHLFYFEFRTLKLSELRLPKNRSYFKCIKTHLKEHTDAILELAKLEGLQLY